MLYKKENRTKKTKTDQKVAKFYRRLVEGKILLRTIQTSVKLGDFAELYLRQFSTNPLNIGILFSGVDGFSLELVPVSQQLKIPSKGLLQRHRNSRVCPGWGIFRILSFASASASVPTSALRPFLLEGFPSLQIFSGGSAQASSWLVG